MTMWTDKLWEDVATDVEHRRLQKGHKWPAGSREKVASILKVNGLFGSAINSNGVLESATDFIRRTERSNANG